MQRLDSAVTHVLGSATHAKMYQVDPNTGSRWTDYDCEGPLIVFQRGTSYPRFSFVIANRRSREDFTHSITASFRFQLDGRLLIFQSQPDDTGTPPTNYGIWFPDDNECTNISKIISKCVEDEIPAER